MEIEKQLGEFSISAEEEERIRAKAKREGEDPDEAVEAFKKKFEKATERKRAEELQKMKEDMMKRIQGEEAPSIEELKREWEE